MSSQFAAGASSSTSPPPDAMGSGAAAEATDRASGLKKRGKRGAARSNLAAPQDSPALGLATVDLDGDCLFHALAVGAGGSGPTLRQEVADFLEAKVEPSNFQDEWLTEAERLRRRLWGGAASCVAFP